MFESGESISIPPDRISRTPDGRFQGAGYVFRRVLDELKVDEVPFNTNPKRALNPFLYKEPIADPSNPLLKPTQFSLDKTPRKNYYPLAITTDSFRPPNNLHEPDDGLFTSVNIGSEDQPNWIIKYFARSGLHPKIWEQSLELLDLKPRRELIPIAEAYPSIDLPDNVHIHFYFSRHKDKADLVDTNHFRQIVKNSDIFIPEAFGWTAEHHRRYNKISKGDYNIFSKEVEDRKRERRKRIGYYPEFEIELMRAVYGSKATIEFIDIPAVQTGENIPSMVRLFNSVKISNCDFYEAIDSIDFGMREEAHAVREREITIINNLGSLFPRVFEQNKKLKTQSNVNVVIQLGSNHTTVFDSLARDHGDKISNENSVAREADPIDRILEKYIAGEIDQMGENDKSMLLAQALALFIAFDVFRTLSKGRTTYSTATHADGINSIIGRMSYDQLVDLFNASATNDGENMTLISFASAIDKSFSLSN